MINKESDIWTKYFKNEKSFLFKTRIEPKSIGAGLPDILLVNKNKKVILIELKLTDKYYKKPKFRPSQLAFKKIYPSTIFCICGIKGTKDFYLLQNYDKDFNHITFSYNWNDIVLFINNLI